MACVGSETATAGASATTWPLVEESLGTIARLEATTAAVAAVGTMNAESTGRVRTAASTPPAVFCRSAGAWRPVFFFADSAEKIEPVFLVFGAECLPTVVFLVIVTECLGNSEMQGEDLSQPCA